MAGTRRSPQDGGSAPAGVAGSGGRTSAGAASPATSGWAQRARVCASPASLRRTSAIATAVGTVLVVINQLSALVHGPRPVVLWVRVALDFVVPFCVANLGVLSVPPPASLRDGPR